MGDDYLRDAVAGGAWIFLGGLIISLSGFVFWLLVAGLAGVEAVGVASAVVSAAMIASTLSSAGLNLAVARETAARSHAALREALVIGLILGLLAAALSLPLTGLLGYTLYAPLAAALALVSVISQVLQFGLVGLERFRGFALAVTVGSAAKLGLGASLALLSLGALAALVGFLSFPLTASLAALVMLWRSRAGDGDWGLTGMRRLASLAVSNYPFILSTQLLTMLGVYLFAYLTGEASSTGVLYISMMIALALGMIPQSILGAALPIATRRDTDPFAGALRLGLGLATPLVAAIAAAPALVLSTINPELAGGAWVLRILVLSMAPLAFLTAAITRYNKEGEPRPIAVIGVVRLATLVLLLPPLTKLAGVEGAAVAYLASTIAPIPLAARSLRARRALLVNWSLHAIAALAPTLAGIPQLLGSLSAAMASVAVLHLTNTLRLGEIVDTIREAAKSLMGR